MTDKPLQLAALYDIHGNLPALDAVLDDVRSFAVDGLLIGGDIVTGPMPRETLDRLQSAGLPVYFLRGNADREVALAFDGQEIVGVPEPFLERLCWTARQLTRVDRDFLADLPPTLVFNVEGVGDVLFCHGSPRSDEETITPATPAARLAPMLDGVSQSVVVCGHTHMQFTLVSGTTRVVNAGSVGMPYGKPGAYWALLGPDILLRHTPYDLEAAAARIRQTTFPDAEDFAANNVLHVPTAQEAIAAFEPKEGAV